MPIYTDANGDDVELPDLQEIEELRTKAGQITDLETELEKLRSKELNFNNLRHSTKEEKEKIREEMRAEMSEKERYLMEEIDTLKGNLSAREEREAEARTQRKQSMIDRLAKGDDSLKQKIETHFSRLGDPLSDEALVTQVDEAFALAARDVESTINPVNAFVPSTGGQGYPSQEKRANFADTPQGQALAKDLGLQLPESDKK